MSPRAYSMSAEALAQRAMAARARAARIATEPMTQLRVPTRLVDRLRSRASPGESGWKALERALDKARW